MNIDKSHDTGYAVGIDGEILLGLGKTVAEAWADARQNGTQHIIEHRGEDVQTYIVNDYAKWVEHGDGYNRNTFGDRVVRRD